MEYKLIIKPAIDVTERHGLQYFLQSLGYEIAGGGQMTDGTECDISFYKSAQAEGKEHP